MTTRLLPLGILCVGLLLLTACAERGGDGSTASQSATVAPIAPPTRVLTPPAPPTFAVTTSCPTVGDLPGMDEDQALELASADTKATSWHSDAELKTIELTCIDGNQVAWAFTYVSPTMEQAFTVTSGVGTPSADPAIVGVLQKHPTIGTAISLIRLHDFLADAGCADQATLGEDGQLVIAYQDPSDTMLLPDTAPSGIYYLINATIGINAGDGQIYQSQLGNPQGLLSCARTALGSGP